MKRGTSSGSGDVRISGDPNTGAANVPYHHGKLRKALLEAAEAILRRDGIKGLTLRAAARDAGVSHAAPKNHFNDIRGLQSELAAVGFARLASALQSAADTATTPDATMDAIGEAYVRFARDNSGLFLLMYRSEMLDFERPSLRIAVGKASDILAVAIDGRREELDATGSDLERVADIAAAWCLVHGFAMLLIDRRLQPLLAHVPGDDNEMTLLRGILVSVKAQRLQPGGNSGATG